ncbi:MAG TPA: hypothetical protein VJT09_19620 [Pyrinomonadaceae bacterium]|nr:hypothetical protein [Pyrinomonadaceae bacterium]
MRSSLQTLLSILLLLCCSNALESSHKISTDVSAAPSNAQAGVYTLYMSTSGKDSNNGLTPGTPVKTLRAVQKILHATRPNGLSEDVEVRIGYGTYHGQTVSWDYYSPNHTITFMPIDYAYAGSPNRPVFDGNSAEEWFFKLIAKDGKPTNIRFHYLRIQKYVPGGIIFRGDRNDFSKWNGHNEIYGCYFYRIGNKGTTSATFGYAAVDLVNSDHNTIDNSHFTYIRNNSPNESHIHALYVAHNSSDNIARRNRYYKINGDPIKVRDYSNFNTFDGDGTDDYELTGKTAFYQDWYCMDTKLSSRCPKTTGETCTKAVECPSYENRFRFNKLECGHSGRDISVFRYFPADPTCNPPGCPPPPGVRLHTAQNTKNCP